PRDRLDRAYRLAAGGELGAPGLEDDVRRDRAPALVAGSARDPGRPLSGPAGQLLGERRDFLLGEAELEHGDDLAARPLCGVTVPGKIVELVEPGAGDVPALPQGLHDRRLAALVLADECGHPRIDLYRPGVVDDLVVLDLKGLELHGAPPVKV